jgi:hypothetical protein
VPFLGVDSLLHPRGDGFLSNGKVRPITMDLGGHCRRRWRVPNCGRIGTGAFMIASRERCYFTEWAGFGVGRGNLPSHLSFMEVM